MTIDDLGPSRGANQPDCWHGAGANLFAHLVWVGERAKEFAPTQVRMRILRNCRADLHCEVDQIGIVSFCFVTQRNGAAAMEQ